MKNCFGYVRVSTVKQGDGVSLEAQREAIEVFTTRNNIKIIQWFEETITAAKKGRPQFNRMVSALRQRRADGVIFHKIDRSARNFSDWGRIGDLSELGIEVHFAHESLDFNSRGGRLTADIQAVIAADYIRNLKEETRKGIYGRLKQGIYPFKAPLGYLDNGGGKLKTIDPIRGPLVKRMFQLYATGEYSMHSIVPSMRKLGLRSHSGKPLVKQTIESMLRNPFYIGVIKIKCNGQTFTGKHEPLISTDLFEQVRAVREQRTFKRGTKHNYRFRGLFHCADCSNLMTAERQKGYVYYRCHTRTCPATTIREELIEDAIAATLRRIILFDEDINILRKRFEEYFNEEVSNVSAELAPLELSKLETRLSRLTDKFVDDLIDDQQYQAKKRQIVIEQQHWQQIARKTDQKQDRLAKLTHFLEQVKCLYFSYVKAADAQKRQIIRMATSNRIIANKNAYVSTADWVLSLQNLLTLRQSGHSYPTLRTDCERLEKYAARN